MLCLLVLLASGAGADPVRVDPAQSIVRDGWWTLRVELRLSDIVPYRVFTLDEPRRLVVDLEGVNWADVSADDLLDADRGTALRFGPWRPGWSRLVVDLAEPLALTEAGMVAGADGADLTVVLEQVSPEAFAAGAGAPPDPGWDDFAAVDPVGQRAPDDANVFTVAIDPGHGGIDPGAQRDGQTEAELMLLLAREAAVAIDGLDGVRAVLIRDSDVFVPLDARMSVARAADADLFISLHADALAEDEASGASVYTLGMDDGDEASRRNVERHERGDILSGVDLTGQLDLVATVLMDLARAETGPAGRRFADILVAEMDAAGVRLNSQPRREGRFAVLSAADFPSVLVEAGFLSSRQDREMLSSVKGRAQLAQAIAAAVQKWVD